MALSISALFSVETAERIFNRGLEVAQALGLPVSTWRAGDPTRSLYKYLAEVLATLEENNATYIRAGFLSSSVEAAKESGNSDWLKVLALEVFGVTAPEATYSTPTVTVTNSGGGFYPIEPGDLTFRASTLDKTFHNTSAGTLSAGATVTFDLVADEAGSSSSVAADDVDELVTTLLGVVVDSSTASVATDEATPDEISVQCLATLGALSPNGPPDAYEYVVRNSELTGVADITRAATDADNDDGTVTVYVASSTGPVAGASVTAAQDAIEEWATPLAILPTVTNATAVDVDLVASIFGADIPADFEDTITDAWTELLASIAIGGTVYRSVVIQMIHNAIPEIESVTLTTPAADVALSAGQVPTVDDVTITEI